MANPDRIDATGRSWPWLGIFLIALPLLYGLSIGPVAVITIRMDRSKVEFVEKLYAPVIWLHNHTALREPLENYLALWGAK